MLTNVPDTILRPLLILTLLILTTILWCRGSYYHPDNKIMREVRYKRGWWVRPNKESNPGSLVSRTAFNQSATYLLWTYLSTSKALSPHINICRFTECLLCASSLLKYAKELYWKWIRGAVINKTQFLFLWSFVYFHFVELDYIGFVVIWVQKNYSRWSSTVLNNLVLKLWNKDMS